MRLIGFEYSGNKYMYDTSCELVNDLHSRLHNVNEQGSVYSETNAILRFYFGLTER